MQFPHLRLLRFVKPVWLLRLSWPSAVTYSAAQLLRQFGLFCLAYFEIALAILLFRHPQSRRLVVFGAVVFLTFLTFNGVNWWHGSEHCSCFGPVPVSVVAVMVIDAMCFLGLIMSGFSENRNQDKVEYRRGIGHAAIILSSLLVLFVSIDFAGARPTF